MTIRELLGSLAEQQIELSVENGRLRYRGPQGSLNEAVLDYLRLHKAAIIEHLEQATRQQRVADVPESSPLSRGQAALWFLYGLDRDSRAYNSACAVRLSADVDRTALEAALDAVHARHDALRSRFGVTDGRPDRRVAPEACAPLAVVDAGGWTAAEVERHLADVADRPFDLERGPVVRWCLLTGVAHRGGRASILLLVGHHIVVDFRSLQILFRDLTRLYRARVDGSIPTLPPLEETYRDYVVSSEAWIRSEAGARARAWWREQLQGDLPVLGLHTDFPRPPHQATEGATLVRMIDAGLTDRLRQFARQQDVTVNTVLVAAFGILLARLCRQDEILIGAPTLGRNRPGLHDVVGYFVNPVVFRLKLEGNPTGRAVLEHAKENVVAALSRQDYPFPLLVEDLNPHRDPSRSPLFQVAFVHERDTDEPIEDQGLVDEIVFSGQRGAVFDITLTALERTDSIRLSWEYATSLFAPVTLERIGAMYERLLRALPASADLAISELPLLDPDDRRQLAVWAGAEVPREVGPALVDLFQAQAAATPHAVAVEFHDRRLTYGELESFSRRLAGYLQERAVGPGATVAIAVSRGVEQIIAVLGVLHAGAACLPIDLDHPMERLRFVLKESGASALLTDRRSVTALPETSARVVVLDARREWWESRPAPVGAVAAEAVAYVLYTSGSTGRPKGVAMPHRALVNLVAWQASDSRLQRPARVLQYTPLTFDVSFQEIATTLCGGGTLVLIDEQSRRDSEALLACIRDTRVERLFLPFVALQRLAETAADTGFPPTLADVITAGEQLRVTPAIRRAFERSVARLHNHYGPTESHVVTACTLPQAVAEWEGLPSIGRPIDNVRIYIVDRQGHLMPPGVPGELSIGGIALADGYLNRPDLTVERFVQHPDLGRIYRTGDLARWRPDGTLEYVGRTDHQIKIRGFRVELEEIEAVIGACPGVRESVVVTQGEDDLRRLVACVGAGPLSDRDRAELRRSVAAHLRAHLPGYMVPSVIAVLERLPQTSSGKIDRATLAGLDLLSGREHDEAVAPRDEVERTLAAVWTSLLGVPRPDVHTSFFAVGGHSLLAARLVSRVRDAFGVDLPLRAVFDTPTIAGLARSIEAAAGVPALPPLLPATAEEASVPSFGQQRLWLLEQLEGPSATYHISATLATHGSLDERALGRAFGQLVARHQALRSAFPSADGRPRVDVLEPYDPFSFTDLSMLGGDERLAEARRLAAVHALQPFDIATGPLFRVHLVRLDRDLHWLLFNVHHIVSDGASLNILLREIGVLYGAELEERQANLPPLHAEYRDYAAWQRAWLQGEALGRQLRYWEEKLAGAPALLDLPADRARPARKTYRGGLVRQTLSADLLHDLERFNVAHASTPFITLLAALDVLLWRYSGQSDLSVGTALANRRHTDTEHVVGFFVNTLVLRATVESSVPFDAFLGRVRETCLEAYAHQDLPFEYLVERLQPTRTLGYSPLFQVFLVVLNEGLGNLNLPGISAELGPPEVIASKFDVTLYLEKREEALELTWEYDADLFAPARIARMGTHFEQLLRSVISRPHETLADHPFLTADEQAALARWGSGPVRPLQWVSVVEAIEAQARRTPLDTAVESGETSVSHRDLNHRANQLARLLQQRDVGRGDIVAICLPRSIDMVVAVLGVLKAGAAYLPLDPEYPAARLRFILDDADVALVISQSALETSLPVDLPAVCWLDLDAAHLAALPVADPPAQAGPDDRVYVIYTSGSTGQPKGAAVFHRGFANLLQWYVDALSATASDRVLLISALGFDLTQKNLFVPLLLGGSLHLPTSATYDPAALASDIARGRITVVNCTPSALYPVIEAAAPAQLSSLRWVVLGGEPIQMSKLRPWLDAPTCSTRVLNSYGPTECTDICAVWAFDREAPDDPVPLGVPIQNVQVAVLDAHGAPVPSGVPGELWIGGAGVGAGYLNRAELNEASFRDVGVFGGRSRMYRTGDRVRWRRDGVLEYLGRGDDQIKLRGFRIELGEIEQTLADAPGVAEAIVVVHGTGVAERLVAFVVAAPSVQTVALQRHLQERLPSYMVPAQWVYLDRLPLTAHGKVDRRALTDPDAVAPPLDETPSRTATEARLLQLWTSLLGLRVVDRHADFFASGGHSLLATRLVARIRDEFGVDVPLRSLFEQPTLAAVATAIDDRRTESLPPLVVRPPDAPPVLSFAQQRLWFLDRLEAGSTAYNIPATLEIRGDLDRSAVRRSLCELVARHSSLRLCIASDAGEPTARLLPPFDPLDEVVLEPLSENDVAAAGLASEHAREPFDLASGPLFRVRLVALEPTRYWLLFNMHHIISDGWSMDVLVREFRVLYGAYHSGNTPDLPPPGVEYSDYAAWQRSCLAGDALDQQLAYWRRELAEAPESLTLPTDFSRPAALQHRAGEVPLRVDADLAARLAGVVRAADSTPFMGLLATFAVLLYRYGGQRDIPIGIPIANRTHSAFEHVVGLFLNTLVIRARVPARASFLDVLAHVRRSATGAYAHQDVPFELLVEHLQPRRSLGRHPLFQVMLNLVNTRRETVGLAGVDVSRVSAPLGLLSKFDLSLSFTEAADGALQGRLEYNAELFAADSATFMAECFVTLLKAIVDRPAARLGDLSVLSSAWRVRCDAVARLRPDTAPVAFGSIDQSIVAKFGDVVRRHPERIAVSTPAVRLTYRALDAAARRLAGALLRLPPTPQIALLLHHDADIPVGVMGVLYAGRAYVPLDLAHPPARLGDILNDSGAAIIVCSDDLRSLATRLAGETGHVLALGDLRDEPLNELPAVSPDAVAYLLYTSGSTGKPKGVVQSHRNVLHFMREYAERLHVAPGDRLLQVASYAFDASVMDMFGALLSGASLHPVDLKQTDVRALCAWLETEGVSIYHSTPTVFRLFVAALRQPPAALRLVVLGGEAVTIDDFEAFRRSFGPDCLFVNGFGPTESTVTSQCILSTTSTLFRPRVPVGEAVASTDILLIDEDEEATELWGEVVIRSRHVALGYWRQDSRAFSDDDVQRGKRRYRTGDMGRRLPDGRLEIAGRRDQQVKVRGFRIELGDIEAALRQHPAVREAAVVLWPSLEASDGPETDRVLVAYVSGAVDVVEMRDWLRTKLPDYMVPTSTIVLPSLPMTATGKLDRRALPDPVAESCGGGSQPATETEALLASLWSDLLGVATVSREADFFDLGGHSLMAAQLVSRVADSFGADVPLRLLFEHPVLRDQAAAVERCHGDKSPAMSAVTPLPADAPVTLSFGQHRLWLLSAMDPAASSAYTIHGALTLDGPIDERALRAALCALTARHQSLRLNVRNVDGTPVVGLRQPYDPFHVETLTARELSARADAHARQPFDVAADPLFRVTLVRTGDETSALLVSLHHIVADGWSLGVLVREVSALYARACAGESATLPALAVQYGDYAAWQHAWMQGPIRDAQLAYWREHLAGAPTLLSLPTDHPRPAVRSHRGAQCVQRLSPELAERVRVLSRREGVTLYMTLLAAFTVLLHRYSESTNIIVGSPVAGRPRRELEGLVGMFANTVPLRIAVNGDESFRDLLATVRRIALDAYAHQDVPFDHLVDQLQPERSPGHTPIYQVLFALQNVPLAEAAFAGVRVMPLAGGASTGTAKVDLTVSFTERDGALSGVWEYSTDLFAEESIARMTAHFEVLLEGVVAEPEGAVGTVALLTAVETARLAGWETGARPGYPREASVPAVWRAQVAARPTAVAVVEGTATLTYGGVAARAGRWAGRLRAAGVGRETRVGVYLERSTTAVVGLVAILEAGGTYVPLDPGDPPARVAAVVAAAGVTVVVTTADRAGAVPAGVAVCLEDGPAGAEAADGDGAEPTAEGLAYVMYTSGSTGTPKGVGVRHRGIVRLVCETDYLRLGPGDRVGQASTLTFDAATFEIWGPLLTGGTVVVLPAGAVLEAATLGATLRAAGITVLFVTTALFHRLAQAAPGVFGGLRALLFGGEAVEARWVRAVQAAGGPGQLLHVYGPTECTTFATWHAVGAVAATATTVPIGRPIAQTTAYVLDGRQQRVPVGVTGELYLGGDGVAAGYVDDAALTAARFVTHPVWGRLYRTGDQGRWTAAGTLAFFGRRDHQVKLRGFRVELGEIETVLRGAPGVTDAVVVVRGTDAGRALVAYAAGPAVAEGALTTYLAARLPPYLRPARVVGLAALPLTAHGKVDRAQLPAPAARAAGAAAPETPTEAVVAAIWGEVLGEAVGPTDDFFARGGHSLLAMQVVGRVRAALGVEVGVATLFAQPQLRAWAAGLDAAPRGAGAPIPVQPAGAAVAVSFAQQRLWALAAQAPGAGRAYGIHAAVTVTGALDVGALRTALRGLTARHQSLRLNLVAVDGTVEGRLRAPDDPLTVAQVAAGAVAARVAAAVQAPWDLAGGRLFAVTLLQTGEATAVLLVRLHHVIADGWSLAVVGQELSALYAAAQAGRAAELPPLPLQYGDYAAWQRAWVAGPAGAAARAYWQGQLAGAAPLLALPTDQPRPAVQDYAGAQAAQRLEAGLVAQVRVASQAAGVTLYMTLLTALAVLLQRVSGAAEVLIGSPVANRSRPELEGLVGLVVNTVVLRIPVTGAETGTALLATVRAVTLAAYAQQELPFEAMVEAAGPARSGSHSPLVQVLLAVQNAPAAALTLPGVRVTPYAAGLETGTAKADLCLSVTEEPGGTLAVGWEYRTALLTAATIARWQGYFAAVLTGLVTTPGAAVGTLPLLPAGEAATLAAWAGAPARGPAMSVPALVAAQVAAHPEAVAVVDGAETLTYAALGARAAAVAAALRAAGVTAETPVGLCVTRTASAVIGMLGILEAGGAYVPLDPDDPPARLAALLADTGARVVLTQPAHVARLAAARAAGPGAPAVWSLDAAGRLPADVAAGPGPPGAGAAATQLAAILYTSGSTGPPKGVCVLHQGMTRLVAAPTPLRLGMGAVLLHHSPITFDASTLEVWGALLTGGTVVVCRPARPSLAELATLIRRHGVTTLWLPAGLFHLLVDQEEPALAGVRQLVAGGDVVSVAHVRRARALWPACEVINGYGPTENTTFTCCYPVGDGAGLGATVPIGRPIAGTEVYVLDAHQQPVPVGVPGELYTGGTGVARGYWRQPAATAARFVAHPTWGRLYRTGDQVRWRPDGTLEFLGRLDRQIKLRGFRVEPGEIEAALRADPAVRDAAVAVTGTDAHRRLVAYVVADAAAVPAVRARLDAALPAYLHPAVYVPLAALPLTAAGKVDRAALPAPPPPAAAAVPPATAREAILAALWAAVLRVPVVGRTDNFFALGGDSILAIQIVARAQARGLRCRVADLFTYQTIADLAPHLQDAADPSLDDSREIVDVIPRMPRDGTLPLSFSQERLWFLSQLEPENPFYNTPLALWIRGDLNTGALTGALQDILDRHEVLRTAFVNDAGRPRQVVRDAVRLRLIEHDLSALPPREIERAVLDRARAEARTPFLDLATPPLVRAVLLKMHDTEHAFLLTMHHIVTDGWSLSVLTRELAHFYNARCTGTVATLAPLAVQYADFAAWQRQWLAEADLDGQLEYWRRQLSGAPPVLALPTDRPRPAIQRFRGGSVRFTVDPDTRHALHRTARDANATLFMTLLGAFAVLLYRYSNQADIVIGSPIANRSRPELEDLVGFFVNTLALRIDLAGEPCFGALLDRVQRLTLDAYAHQDAPFERLVDQLQPERDLSRSPLFQVMFALQNMPSEAVELDGLTLSSIHIERSAALFDLVLDMWDTEDGLTGVLEFNRDIFDEGTAERLVQHLQNLLRALVSDPAASIDVLPLMDADETARVLDVSTGPVIDHPVNETFATAFARQVAAAPTRTAAVAGPETIRYDALNRRANRIAHRLRTLGVERKTVVGVLVPRGINFLTAVLGVTKSGGTFLPLDTAYPADRLRHMIADSQCRVLLADLAASTELRTWLPPNVEIVLVAEAILSGDDCDPPVTGHHRDPLYTLYTSGSTGLPKGALVCHDGALNHIYAEIGLLRFHPSTAFLQSAPASSDISVWQNLAPLLVGGRTVIADFETMCSPAALFQLIRDEQITLIELVPVVLESLVAYAAGLSEFERALPHLEWAMVTGEAVSVPLVNRWFATWPDTPLVNAYGPTEAADDVCQHVLRGPMDAMSATTVPIGTPLDNLAVMVLDRRRQLVPVGVPGEICVCGVGVGAGYVGQRELTATSFVANPYAGRTPGDTLYRTGDLGRWNADGVLEFKGRLDEQVKIRGFRIEPGEIEAILGRHGSVLDALVVPYENEDGEGALAAYVQVRPDAEIRAELAREHVNEWKSLHDQSYADDRVLAARATFNTIGWDSTYTGAPLSSAEMRESVANAVVRIRQLAPQRLLEIGCGTGLLLYRLAGRCAEYCATDLSETAVGQLQIEVGRRRLTQARLLCRTAVDFSGLSDEAFDTVVLNSVVQYFPSVHYLVDVMRSALRSCGARGAVFVGDVRSLPLLRRYYTSVQVAKAEDEVTREELAARIDAQGAHEQELAIAPHFFEAFGRQHRADVLLCPKRGRIHNEMTRFRYDVVLRRARPDAAPAYCPDRWREDWRRTRPGLAAIKIHLERTSVPYWELRHVANARLCDEHRMLDWLETAHPTATVGELRGSLGREPREAGVDPEAIWQLAKVLPYHVEVVLEPDSDSGELALLFNRHDSAPVTIDLSREGGAVRPWPEYANNPLQEKIGRRLIPDLREHVKAAVPAQMVPESFVVIDRFMLLPSGKIDRSALPRPRREPSTGAGGDLAPRTPTEAAVQEVWHDVLGVEVIGVHDNFFSLGGHSLKATQVVSRLQQRNKTLSLRDIFTYPTIAELAAELDGRQESPRLDRIPRTATADTYPVSPAQRRLWMLAEMGASAAYNMADSIRVRGPFDVGALSQAFAALLARHETLRTGFIQLHGEVRQVIAADIPEAMSKVDVSSTPDPVAAARELALGHACAVHELSRPPLVRVAVVKMGEADHVLLFNMHHIISDGWSLDVLIRELMALYAALTSGLPDPLPPLDVQYRDYVAWQQQRLQSRADEDRAYWRERLGDGGSPLDLPTDFPRPRSKTYAGGRRRLTLPRRTGERLRALAEQRHVTLSMLVTALVKVLLHRYSGQGEIAVGTPVAGRVHPDLEQQIGFFVNTLVLRDQVDCRQPFAAFLMSVRETMTGALEHQEYPFDQVVKDVTPPRDPARNPLFDVMVAVQNTENVQLAFRGLEVESFDVEYGFTQLDLVWNFTDTGDDLHLVLHYNSDLFRADTADAMMRHWQALAAGAIADPETPVGMLRLMDAAERGALVVTPAAPEPSTMYSSLVAWFEATVSERPEAVAITDGPRRISYAELNARANSVARRIRARLDDLGAPGEPLVGLCVERSAEQVIGLIAILKAGAAYVPLDPHAPPARLRFIVHDARARLVVSDGSVQEGGEDWADCGLFAPVDVNGAEARNLDRRIGPGAAAYVIYTSGSTGEPKGAVITHRNVLRLFTATARWFDFGPDDVWTLFHSHAFDFSVWEIWGALLYGGRLVIVPYATSRDPDRFHDVLVGEGVTVLNQTPSAFRQLMRATAARSAGPMPLALRYVVFGGEALQPSDLGTWIETHGDERPLLINMYGITETTVHVTYRRINRADATASASLIGEAIPDLYLYVLDESREPVPVGVAGELYVGGAGLARGYLGRDAQTAERFVASPFVPGDRLYRTGDRVRRRTDGELEYLGRLDQQVKIRGHRIEVGEIAAALSHDGAIREAIVTVRGSGDDRSLCAYYVPTNGPVSAVDLRRHLQSRLPDYMIPSTFIPIARVPLTVNGKLDERALPDPASIPSDNDGRRDPRDGTERRVLEVWRRILAIDTLGPDDNVFDHGAHSMLVVRARHELRILLDREISIVALFEHPTAAALAAHLDGARSPAREVAQATGRGAMRRELRQRPARRGSKTGDDV